MDLKNNHYIMPDTLFFQNNIKKRFDNCAQSFFDFDFIHRHCRKDLIGRLAPIKIAPQQAVDLGSALGSSAIFLEKNYPACQITNLDISRSMLLSAKNNIKALRNINQIQASAEILPFKNDSIDLIFSNLLMPWVNNLSFFLYEINRVLSKDGLFIFSTLGPDSFANIKAAWSTIDNFEHVNNFIDMHIIGDQLLNSGLFDPILDSDKLIIKYEDVNTFFKDITASGSRNCLRNRNHGLTGKKKFNSFKEYLEKSKNNNCFNIELELIYGHAWGGTAQTTPNEYSFDVSQITKR